MVLLEINIQVVQLLQVEHKLVVEVLVEVITEHQVGPAEQEADIMEEQVDQVLQEPVVQVI